MYKKLLISLLATFLMVVQTNIIFSEETIEDSVFSNSVNGEVDNEINNVVYEDVDENEETIASAENNNIGQLNSTDDTFTNNEVLDQETVEEDSIIEEETSVSTEIQENTEQQVELLQTSTIPSDLDVYSYVLNNTHTGTYIFEENALIGEYDAIDLLKFQLDKLSADPYYPVWTDNVLNSIPVANAEVFTLLSNTHPSIYQNTDIQKADSFTGIINVKDIYVDDNLVMSFNGLGSSEYNFAGKLTMNSFYLSKPLFKYIDLNNTAINNDTIEIFWVSNNNETAAFAENAFSNESVNLKISIKTPLGKFENIEYQNITTSLINNLSGGLNLTVQTDGNCGVKNIIANLTNTTNASNAGGVINTYINNANDSLIISFEGMFKEISVLANAQSVISEKGNAGALIGSAKGNVKINSVSLPNSYVQAPNGSAGGIIGLYTSDNLNNFELSDVDLSKAAVSGFIAGGLIGNAKNINLLNNGSLILAKKVGDSGKNLATAENFYSTDVGGLFGRYAYSLNESLNTIDDSLNIDFTDLLLSATGNAGGIIGLLSLNGNQSFTVQGITDAILVTSKFSLESSGSPKLGGLIGAISSTGENNLYFKNIAIESIADTNPKYYGGLVASTEGKVYYEIEDISIFVPKPIATDFFGGLLGCLKNSIAKIKGDITIVTYNEEKGYPFKEGQSKTNLEQNLIKAGGGLIGDMSSSIVELNGNTNLSNTGYVINSYDDKTLLVGQLVGKFENSILYSHGNGDDTVWTFNRPEKEFRVDDIGSYDEIIRNASGLFNITDGNFTYSQTHEDGSNRVFGTINDVNDFILHALYIKTEGMFNLLNVNSKEQITETNITLENDIDLSGTGVYSLTRDHYDSTPSFLKRSNVITFEGNNHTITYKAGESFGLRNGTLASGTGSGYLYRHNRLGLFGEIGNIVIQNLKVAGEATMEADYSGTKGLLIGKMFSSSLELKNVEVSGSITFNSSTKQYVAGVVGYAEMMGGEINVYNITTDVNITYNGTPSIDSANNAANINIPADSEERMVTGNLFGMVEGNNRYSLNIANSKLTGTISDNGKVYAVGGISAIVKNLKEVNIWNVKIEQSIVNKANTSSGGFLGYYWENTDINFNVDEKGSDIIKPLLTEIDKNSFAVNINNSTVNTFGDLGGLCYAASGRWLFGNKAVKFDATTLSNNNKTLGLLVNAGFKQSTAAGLYNDSGNALYLCLNHYWGDSYQINNDIVAGQPTEFDEFVLKTADTSIMKNGAGLISLRTENSELLNATNLYVNRTNYGASKQNSLSRYYYNLDTMSVNGGVDSPEELVIWSLNKYVANNIKAFIPRTNTNVLGVGANVSIDLTGYSYYPVDVDSTDITVQNLNVIFNNTETCVNTNLSSQGRTQHMFMQSGLFYDVTATNGESIINIENSTLSGNIGKVGNQSGALIVGKTKGLSETSQSIIMIKNSQIGDSLKVNGFSEGNENSLLINEVASFSKIKVEGLSANDGEKSASSLIGNVGIKDNSEKVEGIILTFDGIKLPDKKGRFTDATLLKSFYYDQNSSAVYNFTKDEDWEGTTHIKNVTYGMEIGGTVQYVNSTSNPGQWKYLLSNEYVSHTGKHFNENVDTFGDYLPYVKYSPATNNFYNEDYSNASNYYEIKINDAYQDLNDGCGSYGDPFIIDDALDMKTISEYIATGVASTGWKINIVSGAEKPCANDYHSQYEYLATGEWKNANNDTLTNAEMREYMASAYYMVVDDVELDGFSGLGTSEYQFKGVVVGRKTDGTKPTIKLKGDNPSFIRSSYGSVVKNLTIDYSGATINLLYEEIVKDYTSRTFFGGVIGSVMGGDNIIDGVSVIMGDITLNNSLTPYLIPVGAYVGVISGGGVIFRNASNISFSVKVGANIVYSNEENSFDSTGKMTGGTFFYVNNFVGRVLEGYSFSEGCDINNTSKNYKINKLIDGTHIIANGDDINLTDAQGMLIYSNLLSSGSASYDVTRSYYYGKSRKANYSSVGYTNNLEDWGLAILDNQKVSDTNLPYLSHKYTNGLTSLAGKKISYTLNANTYDLSSYSNGYKAIGPRYMSNAVMDVNGDITLANINPAVTSFNGNGAIVIVNEMVNAYSKDDHFAVAVGGLFNTLNFAKDATFSNVTVKGQGEDSESLGIRYYKTGSGIALTDDTWTVNNNVVLYDNLLIRHGRHNIGVGGLAGNIPANPDENDYNSLIHSGDKRYGNKVIVSDIHVSDINIVSPWNAGGLIGQSGWKNVQDYKDNYSIIELLGGYNTNNKMFATVYDFNNCTYTNANIEGGVFAGGYIGLLAQGGSTSISSNAIRSLNSLNNNTWKINVNFDAENAVAGNTSKIVAQRRKNDPGIDSDKGWSGTAYTVQNNCLPAAGGLFGYMSFILNMGEDNKNIEFYDVSVISGRSAGGIIAWSSVPLYLNGITIKGKTDNGENFSDKEQMTRIGDNVGPNANNTQNYDYYAEFAGGILGYDQTSMLLRVVKNFTIENMLIAASKYSSSYPSYAGATFSDISGPNSVSIFSNIEITNNILSTKYYAVNSKGCTGGIAGRIEKNSTVYVYNALLDDNILESSNINLAGNLIGIVGTPGSSATISPTVKMYGISVQNSTGLNTTEKVIGTNNNSGLNYYVFADYYGSSADREIDRSVSLINDFVQVKPYVVTSPIGQKVVLDGEEVYLYGDGADAQTVIDIYNDSVNKDKGVRFYYDVADKEINNNISSTYLTEMNRAGEEGFNDFPVLRIPVADQATTTNTIVNYLDIITNGGYSTVVDKVGTNNPALKVETSITLYEEQADGTFIKVNKTTPLTYDANKFYTYYDWDSGKNRFELLTIKISDSYKNGTTNENFVQEINIPIVVRRVMEVDFTANFLQGAVFKEETFISNNNLLTANFNENTTAYLSYKYNTEKDYGFQSMAENKGKLGPAHKELIFLNSNSTFKSLPNGTQLILLDRQRNNNAYYLNLKGQDGNNATTIKLTDFIDSNGNAYEERWVSELLNLEINQDPSGLWYLTDEEHATIKHDGRYYRIKEAEDTVESNIYSISFTEDMFEEKFYLVIFIPISSLKLIEEKNGTDQKNDLNGYIGTSISFGKDISYNLNYKLINGTDEDIRVQTPSTYSFLSGYNQIITDLTNTDEFDIYRMFTGGNDKYIDIDVVNKIHISEGQAFEASTSMFYELDLSLPYYSKKNTGDNIVLTESNGFPLGCYSDNVEFFVYTLKNEVPTYYTYSSGAWYSSADKIAAYNYGWDSDGTNMKLVFGNGKTPMSLSGLRTMLLNPENSDLNHDLYIETSMDLYMSTMAVEKVIAGSIAEGGAYTKINYTGLIANSIGELETTTYNVSELGKIRYWQSITGLSEIYLNANDPSQLGINVNDMAQADGIILLTGVYDLSKMSSPEKILSKASKVDFELSLQQKQNDGTYANVEISEYLNNVKINGILNTKYSDIKINDSWETINNTGDKFVIPIRVEVKTEIESTLKNYSNYRIILRALIKDENEEILNAPRNEADYITYTITRINTDGIWE